MRKTFFFLLILSIILFGCTSKTKNDDYIKIGIVAPLENLKFQNKYIEGIQFAIDEINSSGGIQNKKLLPIFRDDKSSITEGNKIARELSEDEEILAIIGHWNSSLTLANTPIYEEADKLVLTLSTNQKLVDGSFKYLFQTIPNNQKLGSEMANFSSSIGFKNIAIYYQNDDYGRSLANAFEDESSNLDINIIDRISFFRGMQRFKKSTERWNALDVDAFFIAALMPDAADFVNEIRDAGFKQPILGADGVDSYSYLSATSLNSDVTIYPTIFNFKSPPLNYNTFSKDFYSKTSSSPDVWAIEGYNMIYILKYALENSNELTASSMSKTLKNAEKIKLPFSECSFSDFGEIENKEIYMKLIKFGVSEYLEGDFFE